MLKKKYKIKKTAFPEIVSKGKTFHSPHFTLRVLYKKEKAHNNPLFSFIVSSKVKRNATDRNLLKRRGYAIVAKTINDVSVQNNMYAFFLKKGVGSLSFPEMKEEIIFLLKKSNASSN
ncbi:MAG: ribonuclease P protein component [bacterium]|nr:ribonuclease P protein component [bacterium]